jgi:hypothetical protein
VDQLLLFVLDLLLRGGLFDFMEHFEKTVTHLKLNHDSALFAWYSFSYRLYVAAVFISTFPRFAFLLYQIGPKDDVNEFLRASSEVEVVRGGTKS